MNNKLLLLFAAGFLISAPAATLVGVDSTPMKTSTLTQDQMRTDDELEDAVSDAFYDDTTLEPFADDIDVSADRGKVTLTGTVDSATTKAAFESKAKSVAGVKEVVNDIDVNE